LSIYLDYTPRRIIAMTRAGLKDDVLRSFTIWLCASCYSCSVECPKQIKITDIMYTLKRRAIREGVYPRGFGVPVLAREFYKVIRKHGRNNEGKVILNLVFKTNPLRHMKKAAMGLRLFTRGRISIAKDAIKNKQELNTILQTLEASPAESLDQTTVSA
jgi:quinone-modifying oxidoreductase subunit QmoC